MIKASLNLDLLRKAIGDDPLRREELYDFYNHLLGALAAYVSPRDWKEAIGKARKVQDRRRILVE